MSSNTRIRCVGGRLRRTRPAYVQSDTGSAMLVMARVSLRTLSYLNTVGAGFVSVTLYLSKATLVAGPSSTAVIFLLPRLFLLASTSLIVASLGLRRHCGTEERWSRTDMTLSSLSGTVKYPTKTDPWHAIDYVILDQDTRSHISVCLNSSQTFHSAVCYLLRPRARACLSILSLTQPWLPKTRILSP